MYLTEPFNCYKYDDSEITYILLDIKNLINDN